MLLLCFEKRFACPETLCLAEGSVAESIRLVNHLRGTHSEIFPLKLKGS